MGVSFTQGRDASVDQDRSSLSSHKEGWWMTVARVIARSMADVVEQFELDGDIVVTIERLESVMRRIGMGGEPRRLAYELQRTGWFGQLRSRHAWEFLPGARGGAYGSGDRFVEFRAQRAIRPEWPGVLAMESAAVVLELAHRVPEQEVVALPDDAVFPKALGGEWRYVRVELPDEGIGRIDGLPSWNREGLFVGIGVRPSGYKDVAGLGQWLSTSPHEVDAEKVIRLLAPVGAAARQRTAYLLQLAGNFEGALRVVDAYPPEGTAWFGPRLQGGRYDPLTKVNDTALHRFLSIGSGS